VERVPLQFQEVLYESGERINHVYFPDRGVVSVLTVMGDGTAVEVHAVGKEGLVGLPLFLDVPTTPGRLVVQVPGQALRMEAEFFREQIQPGHPLFRVLQRYTCAFLFQVCQSVACHSIHSIEERCCRWLLSLHDRAATDEFPLTQEFMAQMLSVRRPTITGIAQKLQSAGLIRYRRGKMSILDRSGLEAAACECYGTMRTQFDRLLG
jgi:CRP-like cAMP-binding protein